MCLSQQCIHVFCACVCACVCMRALPNMTKLYLQLKLVQLRFACIRQEELLDGHLAVPLPLVNLANIALPNQLLELQLLIRDFPFTEDAPSLLVKTAKLNVIINHHNYADIKMQTNSYIKCIASTYISLNIFYTQ